jgi:hypothetical protein
MMAWAWTRLRFASPGAISAAAAMCLAAAVVLDRIDPRAEFLTGLLFGMAVGLGLFAFGVWRRRKVNS